MTGAKGSAWPGQDAVAFQPAACFGQDVVPGDLDAPVQNSSALEVSCADTAFTASVSRFP